MVLINSVKEGLDTETVKKLITMICARLEVVTVKQEAEPDNLALWGRAFELTNQLDSLTNYLENGVLIL